MENGKWSCTSWSWSCINNSCFCWPGTPATTTTAPRSPLAVHPSPVQSQNRHVVFGEHYAAMFSYKTNILWHNSSSQRWSCHRICNNNNNERAPLCGNNIFNFGNNFRNAIKIISASCSSQIQIYLTTKRRFIFFAMFTCCSCMFAAAGKAQRQLEREEAGSCSKKIPSWRGKSPSYCTLGSHFACKYVQNGTTVVPASFNRATPIHAGAQKKNKKKTLKFAGHKSCLSRSI